MYYNYLIASMILNIIIGICLTSPNIVKFIHSYWFRWKDEELHVVESFFWKDNWINEEPNDRFYGSLDECISYLENEEKENIKYKPEFDRDKLTLSYNTDNRRHYLFRIEKLKPIKKLKNF